MLSISFFVILPRSFEFSFVIKIGSPNSIVVSALLNFLRLGRAFSVPLIATGTIGISWRSAKKAAPFFPSFNPEPRAVPSGKIQIISFFLICLCMALIVDGCIFFLFIIKTP